MTRFGTNSTTVCGLIDCLGLCYGGVAGRVVSEVCSVARQLVTCLLVHLVVTLIVGSVVDVIIHRWLLLIVGISKGSDFQSRGDMLISACRRSMLSKPPKRGLSARKPRFPLGFLDFGPPYQKTTIASTIGCGVRWKKYHMYTKFEKWGSFFAPRIIQN